MLISNAHSLTHRVEEGTVISQATPVEVVEPREPDKENPLVNLVSGEDAEVDGTRKRMLLGQLRDQLSGVPETQKSRLVTLLGRYGHVFSLMEGERGETDLTTMHIDTGDAIPKKQPVRRVPFAVRQELAHQLMEMQEDGVI